MVVPILAVSGDLDIRPIYQNKALREVYTILCKLCEGSAWGSWENNLGNVMKFCTKLVIPASAFSSLIPLRGSKLTTGTQRQGFQQEGLQHVNIVGTAPNS